MRRVPIRSILTRSLLAGTLAATLAAGTTFAHECFIYSRSDTGDLAAGSHSKVWFTIGTTADLFGFVHEELGMPALSSSQLDYAVAEAKAAGLPNQFTIFVGNHTIAEGTPAMAKHAADARGVDHVFDWLPVVLGIYEDALAQ
jgi:hypothetical protein